MADLDPLPTLAVTRLAGSPESPTLLVVGPSLGTSVETLWQGVADRLRDVEVLGWDLPGHGRGALTTTAYSVLDLAAGVRRLLDEAAAGRPTSYAGVSIGGAVALALALDPGPLLATASLASAARIGEPDGWAERAALVRAEGTQAVVEGSAGRWFPPGFRERRPETAEPLLAQLATFDAESYARACEALAGHDLRDRMVDARVPVLVAPGELDGVVTPEHAEETTAGLPDVRRHVLAGCAHLPPAEDPDAVAALLTDFLPIRGDR